MKEPTITVAGYFGDKEVTRDEFINTWRTHVAELKRLPHYDDLIAMEVVNKMIDAVIDMAGKEFDRILEEK